MQIGTVESLWRYPCKSMRGEELPQVYASFSGLMGDRVYAVIAEGADPSFPWHTARDQEEFLLYQARYTDGARLLEPEHADAFAERGAGIHPLYPADAAFAATVTTPAGEVFDIEGPEFLSHLQRASGRRLRVHKTQTGQPDCRPLSLFSVSAAAALGREVGMAVDKRRFRANIYAQWDDPSDPFLEVSLVGKTLKIGPKLQLAVVERDRRCKMVMLDPDTAHEAPELLRHITRSFGGEAGVYAVVLVEGRVRPGDPISVLA